MAQQFFVMPDDGMETLVAPLRSAGHTIDIYVFTLGNKALLKALRDAVKRGVAVRAIVEKQPGNNEQAGKANHKALKDAGVQVHTTPSYFDRVHAKSYVVDDTLAMVSTINYLEDWKNTRDYGLLTDDPGVVGALKATFEADWREDERALGQAPPAPLVLSPNNSRQVIRELITSAASTLMLEEEQINDPEILEAIAQRANAGVDVCVIANAAQTKNLAPLAQLIARAPGARVMYSAKLWLHAKLIIADSSRMLVGSVNLVDVSLDKRREVSVITTDRAAIESAEATLKYDISTSSPAVPDEADRPRRPDDSPAHN